MFCRDIFFLGELKRTELNQFRPESLPFCMCWEVVHSGWPDPTYWYIFIQSSSGLDFPPHPSRWRKAPAPKPVHEAQCTSLGKHYKQLGSCASLCHLQIILNKSELQAISSSFLGCLKHSFCMKLFNSWNSLVEYIPLSLVFLMTLKCGTFLLQKKRALHAYVIPIYMFTGTQSMPYITQTFSPFLIFKYLSGRQQAMPGDQSSCSAQLWLSDRHRVGGFFFRGYWVRQGALSTSITYWDLDA